VTNHILHLSKGLAANKANKIFIITGGGNGIERFEDIEAPVTANPRFLHERRSTGNYLWAINALAKFIRVNRIDIVHTHTHYAANIAAKASKIRRAALVQTNHGILEDTGKLKHFIADKYVAINEHIYNYLLENNIAEKENIELIRCGIPIPQEPPYKSRIKLAIAAASRFVNEKGLDVFIKAVSLLSESARSKAEFIIAGEGPLEAELKQLNDNLKTGIMFAGALKNIDELLQKSHVLVYPSRSHSEGFPAIITEAAANNCLVISSDFYGADSIIKTGVNGLLFKQDDSAELARMLERTITGFDEFIPLARSFYDIVNEQFRIETMISKHEQLYLGCLTK
jgi:glycosyltransferase involved in cell wall biosynthesis